MPTWFTGLAVVGGHVRRVRPDRDDLLDQLGLGVDEQQAARRRIVVERVDVRPFEIRDHLGEVEFLEGGGADRGE